MAFRSACIALALGSGIFLLSGCDEKDGEVCIGKLCACTMAFKANVKIGDVTLNETDALRTAAFVIMNISKKKTSNASINSGCCVAARAALKSKFDDFAKVVHPKDFCSKCTDSPSDQIKKAQKAVCKSSDLRGSDESNGSDESGMFEDPTAVVRSGNGTGTECTLILSVEDAGKAVTFFGANLEKNKVNSYVISFQQVEQPKCCEALKKYVTKVYVEHNMAQLEDFCTNCKGEKINPGLAAAVTQSKCTGTVADVEV